MSNIQALDREKAVLTQASHRTHDPKFGPVFSRGIGARLWDVEGRDYIDFTCGYSASNFGHGFSPLIEVAKNQLSQLTHLTQEPHVWRAPLAERLIEICGFQSESNPNGAKVHFNATGSRAVETAWKAARAFRPGSLISISPSYHGRSLATSSLSDTNAQSDDFVPQGSHHRRPSSEYAYCAACPHQLKFPTCKTRCLDELVDFVEGNANTISAVIVEPAVGARGYIFPPSDYWQRLRRITAQVGVLMIADEIQMGLGRTGSMLLSIGQGWQADLVVLGKSLGGGIVPISAVVGRSEVIDALPVGSESETFACTPLAAAIGLEVLQQLTAGPWIERGSEAGSRLRELLRGICESRYAGSTVEGQGASAVVEFIHCGQSLVEAQNLARGIAIACSQAGLLVHFTGPYSTRIVFIPPLTISEEDLSEGMERIVKAFK